MILESKLVGFSKSCSVCKSCKSMSDVITHCSTINGIL